jgi:hypothetical protein
LLLLTAIRTQIKWILGLFIVIFTVSIGFMYGTGRLGSDSERSGDYVVAVVNGEDLHISQLQQHVRDYVQRNGIRDLSEKQMPLIYKAAFDEMVSNRAVIDEVTRLKITAPAEDVDKQLKTLEDQYVTKESFMQTIKAQGQTLDQVRASIGRELAINKMLDDASGGVVVSDDEVKALYDALRGNFTLPEGIEADYAYLKDKKAADNLVADMKEHNDWNNAIKIVSADIVQASSGDQHERIGNAEMVGKLEAIKKLKDGEVTAPIELTSQDYFVVHRIKAVSEDVRPLSEVQDSLKNMLLQSKKVEAQRKFVKELTDKMKVEVLTPDIFTVKSDDISADQTANAAASADATVSADAAGAAETSADAAAKTDTAKTAETSTDAKAKTDAAKTAATSVDVTAEENAATPSETSADAAVSIDVSKQADTSAEKNTDTASENNTPKTEDVSADAAK